MNLNEASDKVLHVELLRRQEARRDARCDYCGKHYTSPLCVGGQERHQAASAEWYNGWHFEYGSSYHTARHHTGLMNLSIPKYHDNVRMFKSGGMMIVECIIPDFKNLGDREQFETAIDWANKELNNGQ